MQQHAIYIADDLIRYMIEKMEAWSWSIKSVGVSVGPAYIRSKV